jgi:hypothetical protein
VNRIGFLLSANTLTNEEVQSGATFLTQTEVLTTTQQETTGTFTFSPSSDSQKLYLLFDYTTPSGTSPSDTSVVDTDSNFEIT